MFLFRLALALGYSHPDYLSKHLSSEQLSEWIAYFNIEPFGEIAAEFRAGKTTAMIANTHLKENAKPLEAIDFVSPTYGFSNRAQPQKQSVEEQKRQLFLALGI